MKLGMIRMDNMFREKGYDANLLMVVHDEFVIECKLSHIHECAKEVNLIMENIYPICTVPITADTGCFKSWGGMKSHGGYIKDNRVMDNLLMGNYGNIL